MPFPYEAGIATLSEFFCSVGKRSVPAPGIRARDFYPALKQVHSGFIAHTTTAINIICIAVCLTRCGIDQHDFKWAQYVTDPIKLRRYVRRGHDVTIREMPKIQLHAGLKTPLQGHFVYGDCALSTPRLFVHGAMKMIGSIEMGAIVRAKLHHFYGPPFSIGKILSLKTVEKLGHLFCPCIVGNVFNLRLDKRWIADDVVLKINRKIDKTSH